MLLVKPLISLCTQVGFLGSAPFGGNVFCDEPIAKLSDKILSALLDRLY